MNCPIEKIIVFTSIDEFVVWLKNQGCDTMAKNVDRECFGCAFSANSLVCEKECEQYPCKKNTKAIFVRPPHTLDTALHEIAHIVGNMDHKEHFSLALAELWEHFERCGSCQRRFDGLLKEPYADPYLPGPEDLEEIRRQKNLPLIEEALKSL